MITIFTPIYNRAFIVEKLYRSLVAQSDSRFEWLIVDDGSTDNIKELIHQFIQEENSFSIRYYYQENGGKHRAINYGLTLMLYEYFFIVDSDDYLAENAVKKIHEWIEETKDNRELIGVSGQRGYPDGTLIGSYPRGKRYVDVKQTERKKYGIKGDKAEIYKASILKTKKFPEFEGENFMAESALMYQFSLEGYKVRYFPDIIYYGEYLDDGLTKKRNKAVENYRGYCFSEKLNIRACKFPDNLLAYVRYIEVAKEKGVSFEIVIRDLEIGAIRYKILSWFIKVKKLIHR